MALCKPLTSLEYAFHRTRLATLSPACKTPFWKFSPAFSAGFPSAPAMRAAPIGRGVESDDRHRSRAFVRSSLRPETFQKNARRPVSPIWFPAQDGRPYAAPTVEDACRTVSPLGGGENPAIGKSRAGHRPDEVRAPLGGDAHPFIHPHRRMAAAKSLATRSADFRVHPAARMKPHPEA
jgi:hypothetical protein